MKSLKILFLLITISSFSYAQYVDIANVDFAADPAWTIMSDQAGSGTVETWAWEDGTGLTGSDGAYIIGVDAALEQDEWIYSPDYGANGNANSYFYLELDWVSGANNVTPNNNANITIQYSYDNGTTWEPDTVWMEDTQTSSTFNGTTINTSKINLGTGFNINNMRFRIRYNGTNGGIFRLENFYYYRLDPGTPVLPSPGTASIIYPPASYYGSGQPEGFWAVPPVNNWLINSSEVDTTWIQESGFFGHDLSAYCEGSSQLGEEKLTSESITISYPPQGSDYYISFDWISEFSKNCGLNSDPLLGDVDFADAKVQISTNGGTTWTTIWQEDDQTIIDNTTDGGPVWPYSETQWYTAVIDVSSYISGSTSAIKVRFSYTDTGKGKDAFDNNVFGGYVAFDNFVVWEDPYDEFDLETSVPQSASNTYYIDYTSIPISQINNPVNLGARILNNGITSFTDANLYVQVDEGSGYNNYGYKTVKSSDFTTYPSTKYFEANQRSATYTDGITLVEGNNYSVYTNIDINGNSLNSTQQFHVDQTDYARYTGSIFSPDFYAGDDFTSGGKGSVFEFKNSDMVDLVTVYLGNVNYSSEFYLSVIKLTDPNSTTGTLVYTSPRKVITGTYTTYTFDGDFQLSPGFYAFMFNQTDSYSLDIGADSGTNGTILRGNASNLYTSANETGDLLMEVTLVPNADPVITDASMFPNDKKVLVAGQAVSITFSATDENGDPITWDFTANPTWLADWMTFTDNADGTYTLTGTPQDANLGITDVTVTAMDDKNGTDNYSFQFDVVSALAYFEPDFEDNFTGTNGYIPLGWSTIDDNLNTGTTYNWRLSGNQAHLYGDNSNQQDEWLISPPIFLPSSKSVGKSYHLEFDWEVGSFAYFCGGIPGVLGSSDNTIGYNLADVSLMISADNGQNWSQPVWKEDDPDMVAHSTDGIEGGVNWGYDNNTYYTSKIDLSSYVGQKIIFAFRYQSKNAYYSGNEFFIDNFKVLMNNDVDVSVFAQTDYQYVPSQHVDMTNGFNFMATIVNQGQSIPDGSSYTVEVPELGYFVTTPFDAGFFATGDTQVVVVPCVPVPGEYMTYNFSVSLDVNNNLTADLTSDSRDVTISNDNYYKDLGGPLREQMTLDAYDGLGTVYELKKADYLRYIYAWFGPSTSNVNYNITILKLADPSSTTGEVVATIDDSFGSQLLANSGGSNIYPAYDQGINENLFLEPGYYAVMFNQEDDNDPIYVYTTDKDNEANGFIRGNAKALYNDSYDNGNLYSYLVFELNDAPDFVSSTIQDETIYLGQDFDRTVRIKDDNPYGDFSITDVNVPAWLTFTDNGDGTATLTGTPIGSAVGTHNIILRAGDGFNTNDDGFILTVEDNPVPLFSSVPPTVAHQGVAFSYTAIAYDQLNEVVTITADLMPAWLTVTSLGDSLVLTGTPDVGDVGNNVVKLLATDSYGMTSQQIFDLFVFANATPMFISYPSMTASAGDVYTYNVVAADDNTNDVLTISAASALPTWLTLTATGNGMATLTGTPTAAGDFDVSLLVTDIAGATAAQDFTISVSANTAPVFTSTAGTTATEHSLYQYSITATDAIDDYLYFETPELPNWLVFTVTGNGTATLQGVPTQKYVGNNLVSIVVSDGMASATQSFTITVAQVNDPPQINTKAITTVTEGETYNYELVAIDEEGDNLTFAGQMPSWLQLNANFDGTATISGIPTNDEIGDFNIELSVSDGENVTTQVYNLSVSGVVNIDEDQNHLINLYPNPTSGLMRLEHADNAEVFIYNVTGSLVKKIDKASVIQQIDLTDQASGYYTIRVISPDLVKVIRVNLIK